MQGLFIRNSLSLTLTTSHIRRTFRRKSLLQTLNGFRWKLLTVLLHEVQHEEVSIDNPKSVLEDLNLCSNVEILEGIKNEMFSYLTVSSILAKLIVTSFDK